MKLGRPISTYGHISHTFFMSNDVGWPCFQVENDWREVSGFRVFECKGSQTEIADGVRPLKSSHRASNLIFRLCCTPTSTSIVHEVQCPLALPIPWAEIGSAGVDAAASPARRAHPRKLPAEDELHQDPRVVLL